MSMAIEIKDLTLVIEGRTILDVPEFTLAAGESVSLMGPNGAGKSSLMLVMALLQEPTSGELKYFGRKLEDYPRLELQRRMAMVFQKPMLLDLSVLENVDLGLKFRGLSRRERSSRINDSLEQMEVAHLAKRRARTLSGGEAQRVAIAQALVVEPEIIFLDEPFSNLDKEIREEMMLHIDQWLRQKHITTVMVTHHRREADVMTDTVYWMEDGAIVSRESVETGEKCES
ncbi:MAG: ATP-binding cassette domain-containing protein [Syntrophomonas sp.]|nr:ATP-binding cassette domain-containing protein [Syntrophomonas sp.]